MLCIYNFCPPPPENKTYCRLQALDYYSRDDVGRVCLYYYNIRCIMGKYSRVGTTIARPHVQIVIVAASLIITYITV